MWDLWWTKWHCARFLSEHFGLNLPIYFHWCSVLIFIHPICYFLNIGWFLRIYCRRRRSCPKGHCVRLGHYVARSGNSLPTFRNNLSVKRCGPIGCPEMPVSNYHYSLRNNPEERSSHLLRDGSLRSRKILTLQRTRCSCQGYSRTGYNFVQFGTHKFVVALNSGHALAIILDLIITAIFEQQEPNFAVSQLHSAYSLLCPNRVDIMKKNCFWCRIHLWFRLMGGLQAKSMTSQRNRAVRR